ncbi:MAG: hypothetical protein ACC645_03165 [Pirellulales bacterium]
MKGSWILGVLVIVLSLVQAGVGEEQGSARIRPGRPYWADQGRPIVTASPSGQTLYV